MSTPTRRDALAAGACALLAASLACCTPAAAVRIEHAWVRAADSTATTAAYFTLVNDGPDTLHVTGVSGDCAASIRMHRTVREDGMVSMREADGFDVPPHARLAFAPGGNHVMLTTLAHALVPGHAVALQLDLSGRPQLPIHAEVRP